MVETIQTAFIVTPFAFPRTSNMSLGACEKNHENILVCQRLVYHACSALVSIVEAAYVIQRSNLNLVMANTDRMILEDMDGSNVARRILTLLLTGNRRKGYDESGRQNVGNIGKEDIIKLTRIKSVILLASIARCCSFLISSHWEFFLSEHESVHFPPQESDGRKSRPLLALLQSSSTCKYDHDESSAVLSAIEELIRTMPFKQMLSMANIKMNQHTSSVGNNIGSAGLSTRHLVARMYRAVLATLG
jgi:hypothetical protein